MKFALFAFAFICVFLCFNRATAVTEFSELSANDLDGNNVSFEKYKNKCVMVVNTGSGCGLTQRTMTYLNQLVDDPEYAGLSIVAFPSNNFNQEKKSREELKDWFKSWNVKYDVYDKIEFKTSDVYQFLYKQAGNVYPKWNYGKYLVAKDGKSVTLYGPQSGAVFDWGFSAKVKACLKN